ncbi:hypothetical protein B9G55_06585 [Saccharibacillus sp. O16]|nr:hypothetical protein B9G55_06585 [Saccharibacillus sp. O16]
MDKFFMVIIFLPLLGVLIWSFFNPRESLLWGKRWMYKEEPEPSEGALRYIRNASAISAVVLLMMLVGVLSL